MLHFTSVIHPFFFSICTSASQHVFVAQESCHVGSCIWTWVSNNLSPLSPANPFSAPAKTSCMAQCHRHPLHLPSSHVAMPGSPGNCGGGQDLVVVAPRVVEGHKGRWWAMEGCLLSCQNLIYKVSGFEENLRLGLWKYSSEVLCSTASGVMKPELIQNHILQSQFVQKHDNQKDWSSGEVFFFFFSWQQWHADRRSSAAEAPAAALSGSEAQRTSRHVYQNTVPWLQGMNVCVCNIWMCAWVSYSVLKRFEIQHLNLSPLLQSVLLASYTDSSCVYICPCV